MRLTFKANNPFTGKEQYYPDSVYDDENTGEKMVDFNKQTECNNKLGQLEDIEDELGVDFATLLKALREGIVLEGEKQAKPCQLRMFHEEPMLVVDNMDSTYSEVYVKGYGKTWALKKEELL